MSTWILIPAEILRSQYEYNSSWFLYIYHVLNQSVLTVTYIHISVFISENIYLIQFHKIYSSSTNESSADWLKIQVSLSWKWTLHWFVFIIDFFNCNVWILIEDFNLYPQIITVWTVLWSTSRKNCYQILSIHHPKVKNPSKLCNIHHNKHEYSL